MPLKPGYNDTVISRNIGEMVGSAKKKGKIGNVKTPTTKKAQQVAAAIAYDKAGRGRKS